MKDQREYYAKIDCGNAIVFWLLPFPGFAIVKKNLIKGDRLD